MCVAAVAWHASERWPLVAIGNRDEFHARAAAPLARWADSPKVIAGRDLVGGGTWLGMSEAGRFALVTNLRGFGLPDPDKASRGEMVRRVLAEADGPASLHESDLAGYNPFSLFVAEAASGLSFHTNRPATLHTALPAGIYGLSNGSLDEPWPKALALKVAVGDWLEHGSSEIDPLFAALRSEELPDGGIAAREPSDIALEPQDTPPFINRPVYGTRCSTVVIIDSRGRGRIAERSFTENGSEVGTVEIEFEWPGFD
ncbi:NRDE family protein [Tsuneonella mangrovi]|uniref:NRDE family protein n=1 Tax=Tsuneonella mangrovi TaxID=1982042 RepID=UPI000BA2256B|nr:NRDE family protein [Tsuneonella mangrovi]